MSTKSYSQADSSSITFCVHFRLKSAEILTFLTLHTIENFPQANRFSQAHEEKFYAEIFIEKPLDSLSSQVYCARPVAVLKGVATGEGKEGRMR